MSLTTILNKSATSVLYQNTIALLASIFFARYHGPYIIGLWSIFTLIFGYFECFCKHQFDITSINYVGNKKFTVEKCFTITFIFSIILILISYLVIFFLKDALIEYFFSDSRDLGVNLINFIYLALPLTILFFNNINFILAEKKFQTYYNFLNLFWTINIILLIILTYTNFGIYSAILSYFVFPAITCIIISYTRYFKLDYFVKIDFFKLFKNFFFHSFGIYGFTILNISFLYFLRLIGFNFLSIEVLGLLTLAMMIANLLTQFFPSVINSILLGKLPGTSLRYKLDLIKKTLRINLYLNLILSIIIIFISDFVLIIIFGEKFSQMTFMLKYIIIAYALFNSSSVLSTYYISISKLKLNILIISIPIIISILSLKFLNLNLNTILITFNICLVLPFILRLIFFKWYYRIKIIDLFFNKKDFSYIKNYYNDTFKK